MLSRFFTFHTTFHKNFFRDFQRNLFLELLNAKDRMRWQVSKTMVANNNYKIDAAAISC